MKIYFNEVDTNTNIETIKSAGTVLLDNNCVKEEFINACIDRETDYPTGLMLPSNKGVAMPHGKSEYVLEDSISVLRLNKPVVLHRMEDVSQTVEVRLVFNLALSSGNKHLETLRKLMRLFQDENFIDQCLTLDEDQATQLIISSLDA